MGLMRKRLALELPVIVCNGASILPPSQIDISGNSHPKKYDSVNVLEDVLLQEAAEPIHAEEQAIPPLPEGRGLLTLPWTKSAATINNESHVGGYLDKKPKGIDSVALARPKGKKLLSLLTPWSFFNTDPEKYIAARERSLRLAPSVESLFTVMSGDLSMSLPNEMYSFAEADALDHSLGL